MNHALPMPPDGSTQRGNTTLAPDVLLTIARLSALSVPGVVNTSALPGGVNRLFKRGAHDGVRIDVKDNALRVNLYLVMEHERNMRAVSRSVQAAVVRAMENMVGMQVLAVNIHIEDVAYAQAEAQ